MCNNLKNIVFCSCVENNTELIGEAIWTLDRFVRSKETNLMGKLMIPRDLDEIQIEDVLREMNSRNCFDFEYSPKDRDCLRVENGLKHPDYKYFSLIYRNGTWQQGMNPPFGASVMENLGRGKIKIKQTPNEG